MSSPPRATYRLQLRAGMDFARAARLAPYLARLGVSHLYLSPPFAAVPGSAHGYDIVDPIDLTRSWAARTFHALRRALDEGPRLTWISPLTTGIARANSVVVGRTPAWPGQPLRPLLRRRLRRRSGGQAGAAGARGPTGRRFWSAPSCGWSPKTASHCSSIGSSDFPSRFSAAQAPPLRLCRTNPIVWRRGARGCHAATIDASSPSTGWPAYGSRAACSRPATSWFDLARRELIQGLRVDHVDGLTDPKAYLERLQRRLAKSGRAPRPSMSWSRKS